MMRSLQVLLRPSVMRNLRKRIQTAFAASPSIRHHLQRYRFSSSSTCNAVQFTSSPIITPSFPVLLFPTEEKREELDMDGKIITTKLVNLGIFSPVNNQIVNKTPPEEISDAHCVGSSCGWLAFISRIDCRFYLANLFSPASSPIIIPLPPIETLSSCDQYYYRRRNRLTGEVGFCCPHLMSELAVSKVIVTSDPSTANDDCIVMICHGEVDDLAFCRIGDSRWTVIERLPGRGSFDDCVYSRKDGLFYALTRCGHIEAFDLSKNRIRRFDCPAKCGPEESSEIELEIYRKSFYRCIYLVESPEGDLLEVARYISSINGEDGSIVDGEEDEECCYKHPYRSVYFHVYRLDHEKQTGKPDSLDGTALFVGHNESFSLSIRDDDHPGTGLKPNSIYFADNLDAMTYDEEHDYPFGGHDNGVYNLKDRSVSPLYEPFEYKKILPPPFWVSSA